MNTFEVLSGALRQLSTVPQLPVGLEPIQINTLRLPTGYPKSFTHWGDHVRAERLTRGLTQKEAGAIIGVNKSAIIAWEKHEKEPRAESLPGVVAFLRYHPMVYIQSPGQKIRVWRRALGYNYRAFATVVGLGSATIARIERGEFRDDKRYQATTDKIILRLNTLTERRIS